MNWVSDMDLDASSCLTILMLRLFISRILNRSLLTAIRSFQLRFIKGAILQIKRSQVEYLSKNVNYRPLIKIDNIDNSWSLSFLK